MAQIDHSENPGNLSLSVEPKCADSRVCVLQNEAKIPAVKVLRLIYLVTKRKLFITLNCSASEVGLI